jgi:hypothetical protein
MVRAPSPPQSNPTDGPFAVSQSGDKGAAAFFAEHVAVRQAPLADRALDHRGEAARYVAEKPVAGVGQFVRPIGAAAGGALRRRQWLLLLRESGHGPAHHRGERHRGKARGENHQRTPGIKIVAAALTGFQPTRL